MHERIRDCAGMGVIRALAVVLLACGNALAGGQRPASLLVFAEFDARPGVLSFLTVTNVSQTEAVAVTLHYRDPARYEVLQVIEDLAPRDTITSLASAVVPAGSRGYCFAYATVPGTDPGEAIDFDFLVGSCTVLEGLDATEYRLNAIAFAAMTGHGLPTDENGDNVRDLDGIEYEAAPERHVIPQFFGQGQAPGMPHTEVILISLLESTYTTSVFFRIHNDRGQAYGGQRYIGQWARISLSSVSPIVNNEVLKNYTDHDPGEVRGFQRLETGWISFWGDSAQSSWFGNKRNPAILAAVIESGAVRSAYIPYSMGENSMGELHLFNTVIGQRR